MTHQEAARRARAAVAYAGIDIKTLAQRTGIKPGTLRNALSKTRPSTPPDRLEAITTACQVPSWFAEHGWNPPAEALEPGDHETRLGILEDQVNRTSTATRRLDAIEEEISLLLEAAGAQAPEGELGRRVQGALTNRRDHERRDFPEEPGSPGGNGG